jgi:demethylmenaquinone methyltransferase/2-methoxy-6-polyprenyl-1,4-benzoquinol methylase
MTKNMYASPPRSGLETARRFFAGTAATYNAAVHLWTVGMDWWWKRKIIGRIPASPRSILDQGCGTGILTLRMARKFSASRVVGVELHREYASLAAGRARAMGLKNVSFVLGRAEDMVLKEHFECITSSYLAKYADLEELIRGAKRMLVQGGVLVIHDFTYPRNPLAARILRIYFRFLQAFGRWGFPEWETVFYELEDFLRQSHWVSELVTLLEEHGFMQIRVVPLTWGIATVVSAENTA